jgi:hypothetical protein
MAPRNTTAWTKDKLVLLLAHIDEAKPGTTAVKEFQTDFQIVSGPQENAPTEKAIKTKLQTIHAVYRLATSEKSKDIYSLGTSCLRLAQEDISFKTVVGGAAVSFSISHDDVESARASLVARKGVAHVPEAAKQNDDNSLVVISGSHEPLDVDSAKAGSHMEATHSNGHVRKITNGRKRSRQDSEEWTASEESMASDDDLQPPKKLQRPHHETGKKRTQKTSENQPAGTVGLPKNGGHHRDDYLQTASSTTPSCNATDLSRSEFDGAALQAKLEQQQRELAQLRAENKRLRSDLETQATASSRMREKYNKLSDAVQSYRHENSVLKNRLDVIETMRKPLQTEEDWIKKWSMQKVRSMDLLVMLQETQMEVELLAKPKWVPMTQYGISLKFEQCFDLVDAVYGNADYIPVDAMVVTRDLISWIQLLYPHPDLDKMKKEALINHLSKLGEPKALAGALISVALQRIIFESSWPNMDQGRSPLLAAVEEVISETLKGASSSSCLAAC